MGQLNTLLKPILKNLTAYDLFAVTVVVMIFGHIAYYFYPDNFILRVPDRIMVPVFLISIGYNAGRKITHLLVGGACVMTYMHFLLTAEIHGDVLVTYLLARIVLNPIISFSLKSKNHFWGVYILLVLLIPILENLTDYGSLSIIMAMAGWINKNRSEVPSNIATPSNFFFATYFAFLFGVYNNFHFSIYLMLLIALGSGLVFWILYNFKILLLNSIKRRPKDPIEKICSMLGHKSLEIYILHMIIFQIILIAAISGSI